MNRRFVALSASLTALGVAALSQLPAGAEPSVAQAAAVKRPPITASAPCSENATIAVRLADNPKAHRPDRLRVSLSGGQPDRVWDVQVEVYSGDSGSVSFGMQRTDSTGGWTSRQAGATGFQRIIVTADAHAGQTCKISLSGQVAPL
jgi:hypothetical protein